MIKLVYPKFWSKYGVIPFVLTPFSWLYILLGYLRRCFVKSHKFNAFTICVGNMSVGGTGKTQVVSWLAEKLKKQNIKFLIVTKAYGSNLETAKIVDANDVACDVGDESIILRDVGTVVSAKKVSYAIDIIEKINPQVIIFDDGMQNPSFKKDFNLLVIDSVRAVGNRQIFPSGPLRQTVSSGLDAADIVIMIGDKPCKDFNLVNKIAKSGKPFANAKIELSEKLDISKKYYAFSGIGDPGRFFSLLVKNKIDLSGTKSFPDHHDYTKKDLIDLKNFAQDANSSLITTKKDYVKINNNEEISKEIICAKVNLRFENENNLVELINAKIKAYI